MNRFKTKTISLLLALTSMLVIMLSCGNSGTPGEDNGSAGALNSPKGHSFQFYGKTSWLFSVNIANEGKISAIVSGGVQSGTNMFFNYKKNGNIATCTVSVPYTIILGGNTYYLSYAGDMVLTFANEKSGCFSMHNSVTGQNVKGSFTVDDSERNTPPANNCG